jgi:hypothetical protein
MIIIKIDFFIFMIIIIMLYIDVIGNFIIFAIILFSAPFQLLRIFLL